MSVLSWNLAQGEGSWVVVMLLGFLDRCCWVRGCDCGLLFRHVQD